MSRYRRDPDSERSVSAHSVYVAVRSLLGALAPLALWFVEQSQSTLVLALSAAVMESAVRLRESGLCDRASGPDGAALRRGYSLLPRPVHTVASAARRALWRFTVAALGGVSVTGTVPAGPCVVVANHCSHADAPVLLATLSARDRPRVAAAADHWFAHRCRRSFCRWLVGGFPVRRTGGRQDLLAAAAFLGAEGIVVVFPEGTRGTGSGGLGRFHTGAFDLARIAGVPVVPTAIVGTSEILARNARRLHRAPMRLEFAEPRYQVCPEEARNRMAGMLRRGGASDPG